MTSLYSGLKRKFTRLFAPCALLGTLLLATAAPRTAHAQVSPAVRALGGFFNVGGYFLTHNSGRRALGDVKFYSQTSIFAKPKHLGAFLVTGGFQLVSASDHLLPFTGNGGFHLYGVAGAITTPRILGKIRPIFTAGLFAGQVRSERLGFDRTDFTPSAAIGIEYPFTRYTTLTAGYRVSEEIHGVNTDGFSVAIRFF